VYSIELIIKNRGHTRVAWAGMTVRSSANHWCQFSILRLITKSKSRILRVTSVRFSSSDAFRQWLFHTVPREWVVYSKPPFSGPEDVVRYIGRYTHSTAISNNRIVSIEDDVVTFWFKNIRKSSRWETTTLPVMEFINRFLIHVLPKHFHRIRYYGCLANGKAGKQIF